MKIRNLSSMTERQIGQVCPNSSIRSLQLMQHTVCLQGMKTHVVVRAKRQTAHLLSVSSYSDALPQIVQNRFD